MSSEGAKTYNPRTAKWEPLTDPAMKAEHEAQKNGQPAPGDRTLTEIRRDDPTIASDMSDEVTKEAEKAAKEAADAAKKAAEDAAKNG